MPTAIAPPVPETAPRPGSPLLELALGAAWLVGLSALLLIVEALLGRSMAGVAIAGAVIVELAMGWAGVRWYEGARPTGAEGARLVARGAGVGALVSALAIGVAVALGWAAIGVGHPTWTLVLAVLRAVAIGVRDELLFRGLPLTACARAGISPVPARAFAALAGAAPLVFVQGATPGGVALAVGIGWLCAALWQQERGGFAATGAHGALLLVIGALTRGEILDLDWNVGGLSASVRSSGAPAWTMVALCLAAALLVSRVPVASRVPPSSPEVDDPPT